MTRRWAALGVAALGACSGGASSSHALLPAKPPAAARATTVVYSNLGSGKKTFDCCIGWTIGGRHSAIGKQWIAAPFVPAKTGPATEIRLALTWSVGDNGPMQARIARDSGGIPGKTLGLAIVPGGLPPFDACCKLQIVALHRALTLQRGVTYWLIVRPARTTQATVDNWQNNTTGAGGNVSGNTGKQWRNTYVKRGLPAFEIRG
jgi:hypothetical protein